VLEVTPGETIDFEAIEDWLRKVGEEFDLRASGDDPYMMLQFARRLSNDGFPMFEYRSSTLNFSEPTKLLDALIPDSLIAHTGDAVLVRCIGNVVGHYDARQCLSAQGVGRKENRRGDRLDYRPRLHRGQRARWRRLYLSRPRPAGVLMRVPRIANEIRLRPPQRGRQPMAVRAGAPISLDRAKATNAGSPRLSAWLSQNRSRTFGVDPSVLLAAPLARLAPVTGAVGGVGLNRACPARRSRGSHCAHLTHGFGRWQSSRPPLTDLD
jgi:hypothetical protein